MPYPKTTRQLQAIFGLAKKRGLTKEAIEQIVFDITDARTDRISELHFPEANIIIVRLGGEAFAPLTRPRRTENYHRQKAGVSQVAQPGHLKFMHGLAAGRGMSADGLERLGTRMIKHWPPRTTAETNKMIEALKAMNKRSVDTPVHMSVASTRKEAA